MRIQKYKKGFTIIELLIVIAIIGIIASIVLVQLNTARAKGRDSFRVQSLKEIQKAVELYHTDTGNYPDTGDEWWSGDACTITNTVLNTTEDASVKGYGVDGYIPDLIPTYISALPKDPAPTNTRCFAYRSDGNEYMFTDQDGAESFNPNTNHALDRKNTDDKSIAVYSDGAVDW